MNPHKGKTGFKRVWNALFYSIDGLRAALKNEAAFRQECLIALVGIPVALWVAETSTQLILLVSSIFFVLVTELLNTAVEAAVDRISFENHQLAKQAKDMGSAAVLLSLICMVFVWGIILFEIYAT